MYNIKNIPPVAELDYENQSIPNGTVLKWYCSDWEEMEEDGSNINWEKLNNQLCVVTSLETYCKLGEKNYEYYNISFFDGTSLIGVSGMYLEELDY
jgi:hypothetical protein